jgi:hypothetical protein
LNIAEIQELFIRAAEIDRHSHEHVGPSPMRSLPLPYVHDYADKAGWRKEIGDKLAKGEDPLAEERRRFWERIGSMPTSEEISQVEAIFDWLLATDNDGERRALLAWARAKAGGKSFRRWCFQVEGIHPETGRKRKNRAIDKIRAILVRKDGQHSETAPVGQLANGHEIGDVSDTLGEDAGKRDSLNSWMAASAYSPFRADGPLDFSWAAKRNELRRQREARKRKADRVAA